MPITLSCCFHKDMTIQDAVKVDDRAAAILRHFHIGGCHNAVVLPGTTLSDACAQEGAPVDKVLKALNDLPHVPSAPRCGHHAAG